MLAATERDDTDATEEVVNANALTLLCCFTDILYRNWCGIQSSGEAHSSGLVVT